MLTLIAFMFLPYSFGAEPASRPAPVSCECDQRNKSLICGIAPSLVSNSEKDWLRNFGFDVPDDHENLSSKIDGHALYRALARFLENSDHGRLFYPEYYTRATKDASVLTLKSKFNPKNPSETDEYFRCSIPKDKFCLYKTKLRPYIGLAAKASGIDYSFLACQAYVESRFQSNVKSVVGAIGFAQIQPSNIEHMNKVLKKSVRNLNRRSVASTSDPRDIRIQKAEQDIARLWKEFWKGTKNAPQTLCKSDLTCFRQAFLAQALWLKTDMLSFASSNSGLSVQFDEDGDFRIEKMDKGDSLLILAASYNLGVTKTIRLVSSHCRGVSRLKECLDRMESAKLENLQKEKNLKKDIQSIINYVMRIRDCSQQFSAEQLDFNNDERWTAEMRTEKQNQQRDRVAQCLLNPCPFQESNRSPASR